MNNLNFMNLAEKIEKEIIDYRRHIHANPELAFQEKITSDFIVETLKKFGINDIEKIKDTGVVAMINRDVPGKCFALRADIDALPLEEKNSLEYKSGIKGISHMCGHDIHTAILLGTAKILQEKREQIKGKVKLIFQPAEEIGKGAEYMIENGALESPKPDAIIALHCWPEGTAGDIYYRNGSMGAASDRFKIVVKGKQCHGAYPQKGIDPIMIAGNLISAIQNIVSREIAPTESAVITIGTIHGGSAPNVIPELLEMEGTIRTFTEEMRDFTHRRLSEIATGMGALFNGKCHVEIIKGPPPLTNDIKLIELIKDNATQLFGKEKVFEIMTPTMGAEDFSFYSKKIPGAMFRLGCGYENKINSPLHSTGFEADEESIKYGISLMTKCCFTFLNS